MIVAGLGRLWNNAITRNSLWLTTGKAIGVVVNFLSLVALGRYLGPENFGTLSYALAFVALLAPVGIMGMGAIVTRELVEAPDNSRETLGTAIVIRLAASIIILALGVAAISAIREDEDAVTGFVTVLLAAEIVKAFSIYMLMYESRERFSVVAMVDTAIIVVFGAARILSTVLGADLEIIVTIYALEGIAMGVGPALLILVRSPGLARPSFSWGKAKSLLGKALPLIFSAMAVGLNMKIDQVMLGEMKGDETLGLYSVAARLSESWYFVAIMIANAAFPPLLREKASDPAAYAALIQKLTDALAAIGYGAIVVVMLLATPAITLVFGEAYAGSAPLLMIHVWGGLFYSMRALASKGIVVEEVYYISFWSHGLGAVINVTLNLLMIPPLGATGAAIATLISYAVAGYVVFVICKPMHLYGTAMTRGLLLPFRLILILGAALQGRRTAIKDEGNQ